MTDEHEPELAQEPMPEPPLEPATPTDTNIIRAVAQTAHAAHEMVFFVLHGRTPTRYEGDAKVVFLTAAQVAFRHCIIEHISYADSKHRFFDSFDTAEDLSLEKRLALFDAMYMPIWSMMLAFRGLTSGVEVSDDADDAVQP